MSDSDLNGFSLNDLLSQDFGIIMTAPPPEVIAERDLEIISIPGRSGDLIIDNGRYKNVTIPYQCAILPKENLTLREAAIQAVKLLKPAGNYARLEDTYNPDYFRMARVHASISVDSVVEQVGTFQVKFDCKPKRFLKTGETAIVFNTTSTLSNPTEFNALPLITVYGTAEGTVTVGNATVEIKSITDQITLDCDTQNAFRQVGDGAAENYNGNISAQQFPELLPGNNPVSWTGGITKVEIIPRWWTL